LVQLYTAFPNGGRSASLTDRPRTGGDVALRGEIMTPAAAWQVSDVLSGVRPPANSPDIGIGYKTGTSYGYRDAWAVGFDGRHVLGVWVGRADGSAVPGITGYGTAAPTLFDAFRKSGVAIAPLPRAPAGALRLALKDLPVTLRKFETGASESRPGVAEAAPRIIFPPQDARLELFAGGAASPLALKLQGGRAPFRLLVNGRPLAAVERRRSSLVTPDGVGTQTVTVIDAVGRATSVRVFVE
ncbi:MAG: penicillin-binding protein 1C, partial [Mesorhizobium sp.]